MTGPTSPSPKGAAAAARAQVTAQSRGRRVGVTHMGAVASIAGILLLLGCLCLGYLAFRRVRLMRGGGVDVCLRRPGPGRRPVRVSRDAAAGWHFGVGRYQGNEFAWYRLTSLRPGATAVLDRTGVEILERRHPASAEAYALPQAASVLRCRMGERRGRAGHDPRRAHRLPVVAGVGAPRARRATAWRPGGTRPNPRAPQHVAVRVRHPAEDEQQVREPVEVARRQRVGALRDRPRAAPTPSVRPAASTVRATCR